MKIKVLFFLFFISAFTMNTQQNKNYMDMSEKKLATFNDAITLMRALYNEKDQNNIYINNILWAASKKLFKVSIPIKSNEINPVITRKEFSFWLCRVFVLNKGESPMNRYQAFNICEKLGIVYRGRGADDSFTGQELLDTFAYFDYYVRTNKIQKRATLLSLYDDDYTGLPEWRAALYRELEEQRRYEKKLRLERKKQKENRAIKSNNEEIDSKIVE